MRLDSRRRLSRSRLVISYVSQGERLFIIVELLYVLWTGYRSIFHHLRIITSTLRLGTALAVLLLIQSFSLVKLSCLLSGWPLPLRLPTVGRPHLPPALLGHLRPARPLPRQLHRQLAGVHHPPRLRIGVGSRRRGLGRRRRRVWVVQECLQDSPSLNRGRFGNE